MSWNDLHEAVHKMNGFPVPEFHITDSVATRAIDRLRQYEHDGYPSPKLLPEGDGDLSLVWRVGSWTIYHVIPDGDESYIAVHYRKEG
jgi:hypothetical protein